MEYEIHDSVHDHAPEHKSGIPSAPRGEHEQILRMFEEFKAANDERLVSLGRRADVLLEEKVDRINVALDTQMKRIDELALKSARPALESGRARLDASSREHKSAFDAYVRAGDGPVRPRRLASPPGRQNALVQSGRNSRRPGIR
jgi:HK97 family phage major capsid protein